MKHVSCVQGCQEAVRIPETVSCKALAAGENTANHRWLATCRSQEHTYPDTLLAFVNCRGIEDTTSFHGDVT
jgi:hypothetical protein